TNRPREPRTVAHLVQNLDVGGLERVVINLLAGTDPARYRALLYTLGPGGALAAEVERRGFAVRRFAKAGGMDYRLFLRIARRFRADDVRVVHSHNYSPLVYGSVAGRLARTAGHVYTAHGAKTAARRATRRFQRLGLVNDVVFVSEDARRVSLAAGAVVDRRVHTIVNGIDVDAYARDAATRRRIRAELGLTDSAPVAGIVARLTAAKDHVNLFDAFVRLRDSHPEARCVVVGDGELRADLERAVRERRLTGSVSLIGRRDDVADVLAAFDVFVLSSSTEGLALTLLEAMAAGLPVVATRVGGNPEVVEDGRSGSLVPPRDAAALAVALGRMLDDREKARRMGSAGRERCRERFGVGTMVAHYLELYDRLARR
ncbi:MAG TPA: glycosyltransferase, partial [Candidatus Krumholzibacteria bacterium]|nr:glycosyltransferase [Candidatus Krumholzibacteria bacterium]